MKGYAEAGTGIELNDTAFTELAERPEDILKIYVIAKEEGCKFYCGSDAHSVDSLDNVRSVLPEIIRRLRLTAEDAYIVP